MRALFSIKLVITLAAFTLAFFAKAQSKKSWKEGKLEWNDFKGESYISDSIHSHLEYTLSYQYTKKEISDTTIIYYEAVAEIDKDESWVLETHQTMEELNYLQLQFDLIELYRRKIQFMLDTVDHPYLLDSLFSLTIDTLNEQQISFYNTYRAENSNTALDNAKKTIAYLLNQYKTPPIPSHTKKKFGYGMGIGLGSSIFDGTISDHFTNSVNLEVALNLSYNNFMYHLGGIIGWNKTKQEFTNQVKWTDDFPVGVMAFENNFGYSLKFNNVTVTPFVGVVFYELAAQTSQKEYRDHNYHDFSTNIGFMVDYKMRKAIKLIPSNVMYTKSFSEFHIRYKFAVTPIDYNNGLSATVINTTIGISTLTRAIKIN